MKRDWVCSDRKGGGWDRKWPSMDMRVSVNQRAVWYASQTSEGCMRGGRVEFGIGVWRRSRKVSTTKSRNCAPRRGGGWDPQRREFRMRDGAESDIGSVRSARAEGEEGRFGRALVVKRGRSVGSETVVGRSGRATGSRSTCWAGGGNRVEWKLEAGWAGAKERRRPREEAEGAWGAVWLQGREVEDSTAGTQGRGGQMRGAMGDGAGTLEHCAWP